MLPLTRARRACSFLCETALFTLLAGGALAQGTVGQEESNNMRLVGSDPLQGRSAYHPEIRQQGERWIAYVGHHGGLHINPLTGQEEYNGTSVLDVTDPASPRYIAHIPGQEGEGERGGAQMVRSCSGADLPGAPDDRFYMLRAFGNSGHQVWDVTVPERPTLVSEIEMGNLRDTHKNFWECDTGIAYLVSGVEGWAPRRMTQIYDLSDPARPRFIRNFGLVGQQPDSPNHEEMAKYDLHGGIRLGNRIYMGYGTMVNGVIQIIDREKMLRGNPAVSDPFAPTDENLTYPVITTMFTSPRLGAHTAFPVLGIEVPEFAKTTEGRTRDILVVTNEALRNECRGENRQMTYFVDITAEETPWPVSNFQVPEASGNFCDRGGRFGTHSSNESMTPIYYKRIVFLAYFNAGVRAVDIRDPWSPKEIGYYIPAVTENTAQRCIRIDGVERCKTAIQTNNLEVDDRGYVYAVDRAGTGLHIVELTGDARAIANF